MYEDSPEPYSNRVFFAGAAFDVPEAEIWGCFEELGPLRSFTCFKLPDGRYRGMGVATYTTSEFAAEALRNGVIVDGRPLYLQEDSSQYALEAPSRQQALATCGPKLVRNSEVARGVKRPAPYGTRASSVPAKKPNPAKAVFFANVPFETTETHLRSRFEAAGPVKNLTVFTTADGKSRGMGVVEFKKTASAKRAYRSLRKRNVSGRSLVVKEYRPPVAS